MKTPNQLRRSRSVATCCLTCLLGLALVGSSAVSRAQIDPSQTKVPSIEYDRADVRDALRPLFKLIGASYVIAPDVVGAVTVRMKDVSFETALRHILRQVDATYRVENGIYHVVKRETAPVETTDLVPSVSPALSDGKRERARINIRRVGRQYIIIVVNGGPGSASETGALSGMLEGIFGGNGSGDARKAVRARRREGVGRRGGTGDAGSSEM